MTPTPTPESRRLAVTIEVTLTDDAPSEDAVAEAVFDYMAAMPDDIDLDDWVDSVDTYQWSEAE